MLSVISYQTYLASTKLIIKTQSEARFDGKVLLVHVMAEVMSPEMSFETRKNVVW